MSARGSKGFTLIELLVVIGILSVMATIALDNVTGDVNQQRFDQTVYKMKNMRRAIIGADKTVNGEPVLEGFVADMGRLPNNVAELLNQEYCLDFRHKNQVDCVASGAVADWVQLPSYDFQRDASGAILTGVPKIQSGWRGPYIKVFADMDGVRRYPDGWQNKKNYDENFGWIFKSTFEDLDNDLVADDGDTLNDLIELRSKGLNNVEDAFTSVATRSVSPFTPAGQGEYNVDVTTANTRTLSHYERPYPTHYYNNKGLLVSRDDFQINLEGQKVIVNLEVASAPVSTYPPINNVCAVISVIKDGVPTWVVSKAMPPASLPVITASGASASLEFEFDKQYIAMGQVAFAEMKTVSGATCSGSFGSKPTGFDYQYKALLPRITILSNPLATIDWEIN